MRGEQFEAAVVAFLDQFIERGAASDIVGLREALTTDAGSRSRLGGQLPGPEASEREGFDAMARFLSVEWELAGRPNLGADAPDLANLLSWLEWDQEGNATADPAQWYDWCAAVERAGR
jgi:hypothetical protein